MIFQCDCARVTPVLGIYPLVYQLILFSFFFFQSKKTFCGGVSERSSDAKKPINVIAVMAETVKQFGRLQTRFFSFAKDTWKRNARLFVA